MVSTDIDISRRGNIVLVAVHGPIRAGDSELAFVETMQQILEGGELHAVLDLSAVPHVDSTGLGRILQAACRFQHAGGTLTLLGPSNYVRNLLAITRVSAMVSVVESLGDVTAGDGTIAEAGVSQGGGGLRTCGPA